MTHGWEVAEMVVRRAMSGAVVAVLAVPIAVSTGWFGRRHIGLSRALPIQWM